MGWGVLKRAWSGLIWRGVGMGRAVAGREGEEAGGQCGLSAVRGRSEGVGPRRWVLALFSSCVQCRLRCPPSGVSPWQLWDLPRGVMYCACCVRDSFVVSLEKHTHCWGKFHIVSLVLCGW